MEPIATVAIFLRIMQQMRMAVMYFRRVPMLTALIFIGCTVANAQSVPKQLTCPPRWGKPGKPLVNNPETARAIFLAVEQDFAPRADQSGFPDIGVDDDGKRWVVYRWRAPRDGVATFGGGQLSLRISKCDGSISGVQFSR
jgi:hypothetical protein